MGNPYWVIPEETAIKHEILRRYMGSFMGTFFMHSPKLGLDPKIVYIDGFAGPGKYFKDEKNSPDEMVPGSPLIVANMVNGFRDGRARVQIPKAEAVIFAIEQDPGTAKTLEKTLTAENKFKMPWSVIEGEFVPHIKEFIKHVDENKLNIAPLFVFVDPFGFKNIPIAEIFKPLLAHPRVEIFFNFMYNSINRFLDAEIVKDHIVSLFGGEEGLEELSKLKGQPEARAEAVIERFSNKLVELGATHVATFRMHDAKKNRVKYFLVHATTHEAGFMLMKDAMYKASDVEGELSALSQNAKQGFMKGFMKAAAEKDYDAWVVKRLADVGDLSFDDARKEFYVSTSGVEKHLKESVKRLTTANRVVIEHVWDKNRQRGSFRSGDTLRLPRKGETYEQSFRKQKDDHA